MAGSESLCVRTRATLNNALEDGGLLVSRAGRVFLCPVADEFSIVVALNVVRCRHDWYETFPALGVRNGAIEALLAKAMDSNRRDNPPASLVSKPLCYLLPERSYRTWRVTSDAHIGHTVIELSKAIFNFGLPIMREYCSVNALLSAFLEAEKAASAGRANDAMNTAYLPVMMPLLLYRAHQVREAREYIERQIEIHEHGTDVERHWLPPLHRIRDIISEAPIE